MFNHQPLLLLRLQSRLSLKSPLLLKERLLLLLLLLLLLRRLAKHHLLCLLCLLCLEVLLLLLLQELLLKFLGNCRLARGFWRTLYAFRGFSLHLFAFWYCDLVRGNVCLHAMN